MTLFRSPSFLWQDVAASEKVAAMPTFFFYKNGHKVAEVVGANISEIVANVKRLE